MDNQEVILVNSLDEPAGIMDKLEAHRKGLLHRAFSIFIFNRKGEMLLQQRSDSKYHSPGLWTNACCSHPSPGEDTQKAALRRLREELRFDTQLKELFSFTYCSTFDNGLTEHEYDHVFAGVYEGKIDPNKEEVKDFAYKNMREIALSVKHYPEQYTSWFLIAFPRIKIWAEKELKELITNYSR